MFLVTGATGLLGSHVVRLLRRAKQDVRALVRPGSEYYWLNDSGCSYFFGDLRDPKSLRRALKGCRYVIHAAGIRIETSDNHHSVVTLKGTQDLIEAAEARGVERFVMVSAVGVDRGFPNPWFDCLRQAEEHLAQGGLDWTILRCSLFSEDLADAAERLASGDPWRVWGGKGSRVSPLARKDVAIYAMAVLDDEPGRTLELGGPETMSLETAVERACLAAGADPDEVTWLSGPAGVVAKLARVAGRRWENWIRRHQLLQGEDLAVDGSALSAELGIPLTDFDTALAARLAEDKLGLTPEDRNERVIHRQFQATVYRPGEVSYDSLPDGPLREVD